MTEAQKQPHRLRVWWIPQVPMQPFHQEVPDVQTGALLLKALARYDAFQLEHQVKGDYCNTGGLEEFDPDDDTDSPEGSWVDWSSPETGEDIHEFSRNTLT